MLPVHRPGGAPAETRGGAQGRGGPGTVGIPEPCGAASLPPVRWVSVIFHPNVGDTRSPHPSEQIGYVWKHYSFLLMQKIWQKKPQTLNKCIALSALFSDISFLCATAGTHCSFLTKTHNLFATNTKGVRWCSRQSSSTPYYCKKRKALIGIGRRPQPSHTQKSHRHIKKLKTHSKYFSLFTAIIWSICNEFICVSSCVRR